MPVNIEQIIEEAGKRRASDIHLTFGQPLKLRIDGELVDYDEHVMSHEDCEEFGAELSGGRADFENIRDCGELDFAGTLGGRRVRMNLYRQQGHISAAIRLLNDGIPAFDKLGLPEVVGGLTETKRGIVLVTGETGSGKSTTLAALLDKVNHTKRKHIITLEDPVEYIYKPDLCVIDQREIGRDTDSYESGMKAILREDPDVILIGEMRTLDTIETAITAAETGHLVLATLHTNSAADAVDRIISAFPGEKQQQIRLQLSMTLKAVISQQLLKRSGEKGRVLACEIMIVNSAIRNLIREGKTPQINNSIQTSAAEGGVLMDTTLLRLCQDGKISAETALEAAQDADYIKSRLGIAVGRQQTGMQSGRTQPGAQPEMSMQQAGRNGQALQRGFFR